MEVDVQCPNGHAYRCDATHLGSEARCPRPGCDAAFVLTGVAATRTSCCPECAHPHAAGAVRCGQCGRYLDPTSSRDPPAILSVALVQVTKAPGTFEDRFEERVLRKSSPITVAAVLAELVETGSRRTRWQASILLVFSLALFLALGSRSESASWLALVVPILLVHELGHLVAMRAFGYRDTRMLFIPFLGAAVTGRGAPAERWQRAVVALAGPLPSLLLGYLLLALALRPGTESLAFAAVATIALNGFNLLPMLPFDGGRVMHEILFSRWHTAELVSQLLAAALLCAGGLAVGSVPLACLGAIALLAVVRLRRVHRLVSEMRATLPPAPIAAENSVPDAPARVIAAAVLRDQRLPGAAAVARVVQDVWERVCARPPSLRASLLLCFAYGGACVSVLLVPILLLVLSHMGVLPTPEAGPLHDFLVRLDHRAK